MTADSGEAFQRETRHQRGRLVGHRMDWSSMPDTYKHYPDAPRVSLEAPSLQDGMSIWAALQSRHSVRRFRDEPLAKAELSQLLWATQGITRVTQGYAFRTAPSAGALYPVETYLAIHAVESVEPGVYHYDVSQHALEQLRPADVRLETARTALDQKMAADASVVFIWTAVFARSTWKYGQRAYRYVYLDAGHIAQNLALAAIALGLGTCQIAALYDDEVNALLGIDGQQESVLYMSVVGHPAR